MLETNYSLRCELNQTNTINALGVMVPLPYTSPKLLSLFLKRSLSATYKLLKRLERDHLVECHDIYELRIKLWAVTRVGVSFLAAHRRDESLVFKDSRLSRISPLTISHELQLQEAHLRAIDNGFTSWVYGHTLQGRLSKRPDAIAVDRNGVNWAIELERFPKSKQRIEHIMSNFLQAITNKKYDKIAYIAPTEGMAWSLKKLFYSIASVPVNGDRYRLEKKHHDKLFYMVIRCRFMEFWFPFSSSNI